MHNGVYSVLTYRIHAFSFGVLPAAAALQEEASSILFRVQDLYISSYIKQAVCHHWQAVCFIFSLDSRADSYNNKKVNEFTEKGMRFNAAAAPATV